MSQSALARIHRALSSRAPVSSPHGAKFASQASNYVTNGRAAVPPGSLLPPPILTCLFLGAGSGFFKEGAPRVNDTFQPHATHSPRTHDRIASDAETSTSPSQFQTPTFWHAKDG
jgi:hypothetical protein